jgi:hypothetical protein
MRNVTATATSYLSELLSASEAPQGLTVRFVCESQGFQMQTGASGRATRRLTTRAKPFFSSRSGWLICSQTEAGRSRRPHRTASGAALKPIRLPDRARSGGCPNVRHQTLRPGLQNVAGRSRWAALRGHACALASIPTET